MWRQVEMNFLCKSVLISKALSCRPDHSSSVLNNTDIIISLSLPEPSFSERPPEDWAAREFKIIFGAALPQSFCSSAAAPRSIE